MLIIDPVAFGDVACTRASTKMVYDRTGTLVSVPANVLAVTYDPSDLTKAPYALYEPVAATNLMPYSQALVNWSNNGAVMTYNYGVAPDGTTSTTLADSAGSGTRFRTVTGLTPGATYTYSEFIRTGSTTRAKLYIDGAGVGIISAIFDTSTETFSSVSFGATVGFVKLQNGFYRLWMTAVIPTASAVFHLYPFGGSVEFWGVQVEAGTAPSSYIPNDTGAAVTRAADVIASSAGMAYSNVAITETPYSVGATFTSGAQVYDPATYAMYQSLVAGNTGNALSDTTKWTPLTATVINQRKLLDQYNNTQTANAEEILMVLSPQAIAQGLYLGNVDATDIRVSVVDLAEGLVYSETQSLIVSNSASSFYNWCFKRIQKRTYAVSVALPPYANALVTIAIKKPGGTAKCGMCALGPLVDVGLSQYGLSREIKDYSTINFNFDGTSNTVPRNFAKRMDVDVVIDNSQIDFVIDTLEGYRQKPLAWIGAKELGSACVFGRYSNFQSVVESFPQSKMNLQIEGTV